MLNAYSELRDEWCLKEFGKKYDECSQEQQSYARGMYPTKILTPEMRYYCDFTIEVRSVARLFHEVLDEREFHGRFLKIVFAIIDSPSSNNFRPFQKEF